MKLLIILAVIIIIIGTIILIQYNILVKLKNRVEQSKSGIDIYYQQRFDLIPNLVEVVKKYSENEEKIFNQIIELRKEFFNTKNMKTGEILDDNLNRIMVQIKNYPELNADKQYLNLQKILEKIESQLQAARRIYNYDATKYNTKISEIPFNIIAKIFKFEKVELFDIQEIV